jgi:cellulose synthase/poly-beta-1,6-N-acetylglucosamine synthase-like glycosyltransferase
MTKLEEPPTGVGSDRVVPQLRELPDHLSARRLLTRPQGLALLLFVVIVPGSLVLHSLTGAGPSLLWLGRTTILAASIFYVAIIVFRLFVISTAAEGGQGTTGSAGGALPEAALPRYTVLVPLYREAKVLPDLIARLSGLDYPTDRLQILLLVEEDDDETRRALALLDAGPQFEAVVIPPSLPRTKPKACNVGLARATGELCTIYDAEDRPEPDQLRKAAATFACAPTWVVCLQSELQFWNPWSNWLTMNFAAEYATNFSLLLKGLDRFRLPIPLGGTSNHFRTDALWQLGGWDPYNVTEDADLGIRIARRGWAVRLVDSVTEEEANCRIPNWLRQRSRWIKGFLQTWLVHMRSPWQLWRELGTRDFLAFQLIVGFSTFIMLVNPIFWALFLVYLIFGASHIAALFPWYILDVSLVAMFVGNVAMIYWLMTGCMERGLLSAVKVMLLVPLYWGLMSVAAYKALAQLLRPSRRHYWEKTKHSLVSIDGSISQITGAPFLVFVIVLASAIGGGLAHGSPTGISSLDLALKAAFGATLALAAVSTAWPWLLAASTVSVLGSVGQLTLIPAIAALGVSLGSSPSLGKQEPAVSEVARPGTTPRAVLSPPKAAVGAVIAQVALRFGWPHVSLVPSLVAAVAALLVFVPGVAGTPRRLRRWVVSASAAALLAAVALTATAGASVLRAKSPMLAALQATETGLHAAERGDQPVARTHFATAVDDFAAASHDLAGARGGELVPGVAQQVRAMRVAAAIGAGLARTAFVTANSSDIYALRFTDGTFPLRTLERLEPVFASDVASLQSSLQQTLPLDSPWLVSPLKAKLDNELQKLGRAEHDAAAALVATRAVPGILGADGPRRYLVLFENPAESRASGGVPEAYAEVTAIDGKLTLAKVGDVTKLDSMLDSSATPAGTHLIGAEATLARESQFEPKGWANVPMSPNFPSVGEMAAQLYHESGGTKVNGVISLDPAAMAGLLAATGPITTPEWAVPVDTRDAVAILGHDEFIHFGGRGAAEGKFEQALIKLLWHDLVTRRLPSLPTLADELVPAVHGGHLLVYSATPESEHFFQAVHVAGSMPPVDGDFLGVVTQNAEGNKIDWYLRRSIDYRAVLNLTTDRLTAVLTLKLHNLSPRSGLPPIIIDSSSGTTTTPGESALYVSIYSRWKADGATLNGRSLAMTDQHEFGRLVYSAFVKVPAGGTATIVLHLVGSWNPRERYQLGMYHQPLLFPDQVSTSVKETD